MYFSLEKSGGMFSGFPMLEMENVMRRISLRYGVFLQ